MRFRFANFASLLLVALGCSGCGNFIAHRIVQAPNTYPRWLSPMPRVQLAFEDKFLTNFPARHVDVGPPPARLRYRIIEPADYQTEATSTNWYRRGRPNYRFTFSAKIPGQTNQWTGAPRGTVVLLHGYSVGAFAMSPWALRLAEEGWRCVLPDLRGHGKSTGRHIFFGLQETYDISELLDELGRNGQLVPPVRVIGDSYGASLALRLQADDSRISGVVAISPFAHLSNAVVNIGHDYAAWIPRRLLDTGIKKLPEVLDAAPSQLDTITIMKREPEKALFIASMGDEITPVSEVRQLYEAAAPGSRMMILPTASHEALPYFFEDLVAPIVSWLADEKLPPMPRNAAESPSEKTPLENSTQTR